MSPRDRKLFIDIVENAQIAADQMGSSAEQFDRTPALKYTALFALLIIGEAASKLSPETRSKLASVPWEEIVATRHFIAHGYDKVDPMLIIGIIEDDLPPFADAVYALLRLEP